MARIENFQEGNLERMTLHDPIDATVFRYELDGRKLFQINTNGRKTREIPGKVSQSIQLDESSGRELYEMLKSHFKFK